MKLLRFIFMVNCSAYVSFGSFCGGQVNQFVTFENIVL